MRAYHKTRLKIIFRVIDQGVVCVAARCLLLLFIVPSKLFDFMSIDANRPDFGRVHFILFAKLCVQLTQRIFCILFYYMESETFLCEFYCLEELN